MLSTARCRELLGRVGDALDDAEVERLRDQLYVLGVIAVERAAGRRADHDARQEAWSSLPADLLADVHERAAIMQFDGGLSRDEAERRAIATVCSEKGGGPTCRAR